MHRFICLYQGLPCWRESVFMIQIPFLALCSATLSPSHSQCKNTMVQIKLQEQPLFLAQDSVRSRWKLAPHNIATFHDRARRAPIGELAP